MFDSIRNTPMDTSVFFSFISLHFLFTLFFLYGHLIHLNCSLDELQVNYNNDRSRWLSLFLSFCFYSLLILLFNVITLLLTLFQQGLHEPKSSYRAERQIFTSMFVFILYLFMNQIFLLIFVKSILMFFILHLLWNSLDMVMQVMYMLFMLLKPGQVLNVIDSALVGSFCLSAIFC